jgi:hypothetical protein
LRPTAQTASGKLIAKFKDLFGLSSKEVSNEKVPEY